MRKVTLRRNVKAAFAFLGFLFSAQSLPAQPILEYVQIISGLNQPMEVATAPGDLTGRIFIVEKPGTIRIWNGTTVLSTPFLNITGIVTDGGEQGLLSMAFHPQYQSNGFFFVYYNDNSGNLTIARYQVSADPNVANPTATPLTPILSVAKPTIPGSFTNHNGGHIQFKVQGGTNYLYVATGDGGDGNDPSRAAQNPASFLGKLIRINTDNLAAPHEIWAWGLRNPFKWSFDRLNGDLYIGDVGQGAKEEIDYRAGGSYGANFGWVCFEADLVNGGGQSGSQCDTVAPVHVPPIFSYLNPSQGRSVVGGYVYRGTEFPSMYGYYFATDYYSGTIWIIQNAGGGSWNVTTQSGSAAVSSISETSDGSALYVTQLAAGVVYKITTSITTPVRLTRFSGVERAGYNELRWTTESEQDIEKYIVEYSHDGRNYLPAGELPAINNSNRNDYVFRHSIVAGKLFYRLQIKETNKPPSFSPVITVGDNDRARSLVYPTVNSDRRLNILAHQQLERIQLTYSDGRMVFSKMLNAQAGYISLDIPALAKGIYFVQLSGKNFTQTEKIIIQ